MELTVFIALTAVAILIQAGVLLGMYITLRKTAGKVEALAEDVRTKVLPTAELAHAMILELRPKIDAVVSNASESTALIRSQMLRLDATISDAIDRGRLQVIRADDIVTRSLDRVEETSDLIHKSVVSPVRQVAGLVKGVTAALEFFAGSRRRRGNGVRVPQDEMFI